MSQISSVNRDHTQFFARIRLHGLTTTYNGIPCPITLERRLSFPMPADYTFIFPKGHDKDLSARLLTPRYEIEARVSFDHPSVREKKDFNRANANEVRSALGFGRSSAVYPLEILSFKRATAQPEDNNNPLPSISISEDSAELPTLPQLCIKVATPGYARNLAREAWFYEQFDKRGLTRVITPRCYGVFHTPIDRKAVKIDIPGYEYHYAASQPISEDFESYTAGMPEELYDDEYNLYTNTRSFMDDKTNSYTNSEWKEFRETPATATLTVLVMDMLDASITVAEFEQDWKEDINEIWDHLIPLGILHKDIRFPNLLRVPPHLQAPCPMHPNAFPGHKWNLIDWETAKIVCAGPEECIGLWDQRQNLFSYYYGLGGKLKIRPDWNDYFKVVPGTKKRVYVGPGLHEDQASNTHSIKHRQ